MTTHRTRRKRKASPRVELCSCCGKPVGELSAAIPVRMPHTDIPPDELDERMWNDSDLCVLDDERFYVYGSIDLAIHGHSGGPFTWGAWVEVDEPTFFWFHDVFYKGDATDVAHAPFRGELATDIPFYPPTLGLPATVHVQAKGLRPLFALDDVDHPLVRDHLDGVRPERIGEIRAWFDALRAGRL